MLTGFSLSVLLSISLIGMASYWGGCGVRDKKRSL
jgi:hypothetical protein